jgi:hypothetical protein
MDKLLMESKKTLTFDSGASVTQNSRTAGPRGPILLEDHRRIKKLAHIARERIPERHDGSGKGTSGEPYRREPVTGQQKRHHAELRRELYRGRKYDENVVKTNSNAGTLLRGGRGRPFERDGDAEHSGDLSAKMRPLSWIERHGRWPIRSKASSRAPAFFRRAQGQERRVDRKNHQRWRACGGPSADDAGVYIFERRPGQSAGSVH